MGFAVLSATPGSTLTTDAGTLVDLLGSVGSLFATYPINLFLAAGIISLVFGIFRKAKNAAR